MIKYLVCLKKGSLPTTPPQRWMETDTYSKWQGVPGDWGWELKDTGSTEKGTDFYHLGRGLQFWFISKKYLTQSHLDFFMQNFPILWMLAVNSNWLWFLPEFSWVGLLKKKNKTKNRCKG